MKTIIKRMLFIFLLVTFCTSCKDYLEEYNPGGITDEKFYIDADGMESLYNGSYAALHRIYGDRDAAPGYSSGDGEHQRSLFVLGTDLFMTGENYNEGLRQYFGSAWNEYDNYIPSAPAITLLWDRLYRGIQRVNTFLSRSEEIDFPDKDAKRGEARFIRAYMYYILTEQCGGVSLVTEEINSPVTEFPRESESDMYEFIISELNIALNDVNENPGEGKIGKDAVKHFLALAHLTRGYRDYGSADDFITAANYADDVIQGSSFTLLDNYADVFTPLNELNDEIIFAIGYNHQTFELNGTAHSQFMDFGWMGGLYAGISWSNTDNREWNLVFLPTPFLFQLFDSQKDSRYHATFKHEYYASVTAEDIEVGDLLFIFAPVDKPFSQDQIDSIKLENPQAQVLNFEDWQFGKPQSEQLFPMVNKFHDPNWQYKKSPTCETDIVVFHLGGTYLLSAEAHFKAGNPENAISRLNTVRERAAIAGYEEEMRVNEITMDIILDEWARETAGSYKRWFTLKRTGTLMERAEQNLRIIERGIQLTNPAIQYRPIPQEVIDLTSNEYPQNERY